MAYKKKLEFANYTLNFGKEKVLLDLFDEVVFPSFEEKRYFKRVAQHSEFFFLDTELVVLEDNPQKPVIGITGRIVKNTTLKREQLLDDDHNLVEDLRVLDSAPSSQFLLILNNHRLILCKEYAGAPSLSNLQSVSQFCITNRYKEFINEKFDESIATYDKESDDPKPTKKALREEFPQPKLRVTPLSNEENLEAFLKRFSKIDKVTIKLQQTNKEEIDNDDFWNYANSTRVKMNSNTAKVEFSNTKDGLNSESVYEQTNSAVALGNSAVDFLGCDNSGDRIKGNNDDFSLTVDLDDLPKSTNLAARSNYNKFKQMVQMGAIILAPLALASIDKIKEIYQRD